MCSVLGFCKISDGVPSCSNDPSSKIATRSAIFRHLVFMTYLNTVDDGGTHFYYQKLKTKAKKGLTLIWSSAWTHTHRGIISKTKEKYILTGWYNFKGDRK